MGIMYEKVFGVAVDSDELSNTPFIYSKNLDSCL